MAQVAAMRQIQAHQSVVRTHQGLVDLQVGRRARQTLNIDTPLLGVEAVGLESAALASELNGINVLVATVVASTRVALRVLVGHGRSESIEDGARGNIFGGNQDDGLALALDLFFLPVAKYELPSNGSGK